MYNYYCIEALAAAFALSLTIIQQIARVIGERFI